MLWFNLYSLVLMSLNRKCQTIFWQTEMMCRQQHIINTGRHVGAPIKVYQLEAKKSSYNVRYVIRKREIIEILKSVHKTNTYSQRFFLIVRSIHIFHQINIRILIHNSKTAVMPFRTRKIESNHQNLAKLPLDT